jgi:hypothetical protein
MRYLDALAGEFEAKYPKVDAWVFSYEYPGFFQLQKDDISFCFTPDWGRPGEVCIQVFKDNGAYYIWGDDVKYVGKLCADRLLSLIKPSLLRFEEQFYKGTL